MVGVFMVVVSVGGGEVCSFFGWLWQRGQKEIWGYGVGLEKRVEDGDIRGEAGF